MAAMRLQPIIVPGWKDSGPEHWQSRWAALLPHAVRVQQRDWQNPVSAEWISTLAGLVDQARSPVLLIAHSLGCLISAALPVPLRAKVAGALLVAPADVERPDAPDCLRGFAPIPRNRCRSRAWWWPATTTPTVGWTAPASSRKTGAAASW